MDRVTYHEQTDMENILKLREVLRTLPEFLTRTTSGFSFSSL